MTKLKNRLYILSTTLLSLLLSGLYTACLLTAYEEVGYLTATPLVILTRILFVAGALWCLAVIFFLPKDAPYVRARTLPHTILSYFSGILLLLSGISIFTSTIGGIVSTSSLLPTFLGIFLLLASVFFLTDTHGKGKMQALHAPCGFLVLAALLCLLFQVYFDMYVTINSPLKVMIQLSLLSALLFILCEIRAGIGKPTPRFAHAARLLCLIFCLPTAVGHLVFGESDACGMLEQNIISPALYFPLLALGVYALSELVFCRENKKD